MLPDMGADICSGDPEFLEQMDGHGNNLIDTNVRIRAEGIADAIGLGIMQQRQHADGARLDDEQSRITALDGHG